jgi:hypothetical protein
VQQGNILGGASVAQHKGDEKINENSEDPGSLASNPGQPLNEGNIVLG